jgi:putative ATP-binding cassette transporter
MNIFDRRLWKRFWEIARLYWRSEEKWRAWGVLALLLLLLFGFTALNVVLSYVGRDFMTALSEKDLPDFNRALLIYLGAFVVATPVSVFFEYVQKVLGVNWRLWLTGHYLTRYFTDRAYYHINNDKDIDNPDQRISQDIASFTGTSLQFLSIIFFSLVQLISFAGILWSISIPLVLILVAYAAVGTIVTLFFGKRLISLNFLQLRREADFRYGLVHIRNNAESIAFYRGEGREEKQVKERLADAVANFRLLIGWERNLGFFTKGYQYIILILPIVVMAPLYFSGTIKFGVVTQAADAFSSVLGALSVIVSQFEKLSQFAAGITRLETFAAAVDGEEPTERGTGNAAPVIASREEPRLRLEGVTLHTPNYEQTLLKNATAEVPSGGGLLIMGPSGAGKSSVLRAVAGLWTAGEGEISRPPLAEMIFLPQRPYMVLGSLRDQLLYPRLDQETTDEGLRAVLETVNLADLPDRVGGFDAVLGWGQILSLGEQQRLAFARLLLTRPRYAVLDEATSALDVTNEALLYGLLKQAGATFVSVGHRPSLLTYHDAVLELRGKGEWRLVPVTEYAVAAPG